MIQAVEGIQGFSIQSSNRNASQKKEVSNQLSLPNFKKDKSNKQNV